MLNMPTITTRDLAHHAARISELLDAGHTLDWRKRGRLVARLVPAAKARAAGARDWIGRARQAGAVNRATTTVSETLQEGRG